LLCRLFFFFQAEDGIRDLTVTGVQTCALPISTDTVGSPAPDVEKASRLYRWCHEHDLPMVAVVLQFCLRQPLLHCTLTGAKTPRSEERRVGKEWRSPRSRHR